MRIVYFGGCWNTNIGNAFIDYGCIESLKKYSSNIMIFSEKSLSFFIEKKSNYFCSILDFSPDIVVFSGMVLCPSFFKDQKWLLNILEINNIPVLINGGGGAKYNKKEIKFTRECIRKYSCLKAFISRDDIAYNYYKDLFKYSYDGIDVGFFLSQINKFKFLNYIDKEYKVINNDKNKNFNKNFIKRYKGKLIYSHHMPNIKKIKNKKIDFNNKSILIAELPEEYIYLYGKTKYLYSSRIHSCVATLSFGGGAMLYFSTPRKKLFDKVGCKNINKTIEYLDNDYITLLKNKQIKNIGECLNELCI